MTSVVFCTPTISRPFDAYLDAMKASVPALDDAGIEHRTIIRRGDVYISHSRAAMLAKAMKTDADAFVFLDHDVSWRPIDLVRLVLHSGEVAAGDYRFKQDDEKYMGKLETDDFGRALVRADGTLRATAVPAGFLKVTRSAVEKIADAYPDLCFGVPERDHVDLFSHGACDGLWWGEDYAFCRRWRDIGGEIHLIPDLEIDHHSPDRAYPGNLHQFLMKLPGGALAAKETEAA